MGEALSCCVVVVKVASKILVGSVSLRSDVVDMATVQTNKDLKKADDIGL